MRDENRTWLGFLVPGLATLAFVFILPICLLIAVSFYPMTGPATVGDQASLDNYITFFSDPYLLRVLWNTVVLGTTVVLVCLIVGYPVSYYLARTRSRWRGLLLFLVVSPLLVSAVVRNIGWFPILGNNGLVNWLLLELGVLHRPLALISNFTGVVIGLVHALLPFMIITLTTVFQRIEPELEDAAASLGARPHVVFTQVLLPLSLPGAIGGSLLVFTMAIAAFTTPVIMGGNRVAVMATYIGQQYRTVLDYAAGATAAAVLLVLVSVLTMVATRLGAGKAEAG